MDTNKSLDLMISSRQPSKGAIEIKSEVSNADVHIASLSHAEDRILWLLELYKRS